MKEELFWILLSKKMSGEIAPQELIELEGLIQEHPEWQHAIQTLEDLWEHKAVVNTVAEEDAYLLHIHRMNEMGIPFDGRSVQAGRYKTWYWVAAAVAASVILFFVFNPFGNDNKEAAGQPIAINEVSVRKGSTSKIILPDGSEVWLNAGSKLVYDKEYGEKGREVSLTGEGFFDVKKMQDVPFIIHTANIHIKVLGTTFNVKAYPEDNKTETSLLHGSVEVTINGRPKDKIILSPSEKLIVENDGSFREETQKQKADIKLLVPTPVISINKLLYNPADSAVAEVQWVNNRLVFRDEAFGDLAARLERRYDVHIEIKEEAIAEERLNGVFESENILQVLDALKESIPFRYSKEGNSIIIHR